MVSWKSLNTKEFHANTRRNTKNSNIISTSVSYMGWASVSEYHNLLNNLHSRIKFAIEHNYDGLALLDNFYYRQGIFNH